MSKPLNRVALAMWVIAALALANLCWFVRQGSLTDILIEFTRGLATGVAPLVALGILIELVDQIRWNALPPEQRTPLQFKL